MWVTGTQSQAREVESELRVLVISMQEWVRQAGTWWCSFHRGTGKLAAGEERPACEHQEISAQGCLADVSEGRFLPAPAPTVLSMGGLRQNPRPDIILVLLQCHLAYNANKKEESILVLSYYFIHACFTLDLLALTLELIYTVSLSDSALEMSIGRSGKHNETRGPGEIMYMV